MRTYVNNDIYNALPVVIKNAIIDTTVVSAHGSKNFTNFTSIDKLYLLSTHEVLKDVDGNTSKGINYYDTAYYNTRQLDYYANLGVTIGVFNSNPYSFAGNHSSAIKKNGTSNSWWWLRAAYSTGDYYFYFVDNDGGCMGAQANYTYGVSPAFRIA